MVEGRTAGSAAPITASSRPQWVPQAPPGGSKSPGGAAVLNFFFPGLGYIYTGIGRNMTEIIFGALVFIFYFIGFEVGYLIDTLTYIPPTTPAAVSPYAALILLAFLLPFAFAYDGYKRAKLP